jgi:hypothetical protein
MKHKNERVLSRREFAQRAALLSATASLASAEAVFPASAQLRGPQSPSPTPKLSDASQVEADSRYQQIVSLYGRRFDEGQRAELQRMCAELQPALEHIRSYELQNGDAPGLYLKPLIERDKKPQPAGRPGTNKP